MRVNRLKMQLLLSAVAISIVVALASMLVVSIVINYQYHQQSNSVLLKAAALIDEVLAERKNGLLAASRQLATQKNLGSTIWYLAEYSQSDVDRQMLLNTYQQLIKDTVKIGRAANVSSITIYDTAGHLISFSVFDRDGMRLGFVERSATPVFQIARLKFTEELNSMNLEVTNSVAGIGLEFAGQLPQQESVHYAVVDGVLVLESHVPVMGVAFDPVTGEQQVKQLGTIVMDQSFDQAFVEQLSRFTDTKINLFTAQGLSVGNMPAYRTWDLYDQRAAPPPIASKITFNEIDIEGESFYQGLIPLYDDRKLVGSVAALYSKRIAQTNTWEMIGILALIGLASLFLILPFAWYLSGTISQPILQLSRIFRDIASGKEIAGNQLEELKNGKSEELIDLTESFIGMHQVIGQKIAQIEEINASLEGVVEQRTKELRLANEELTQLSTRDALTSLPNRRMLNDRLSLALAQSKRTGQFGAIIFIDLDNFKPLNDEYGHNVGDLLLIEVARRLTGGVREMDTVARFGGDEFVIMLSELETDKEVATQQAIAVAEKVLAALGEPYRIFLPESRGEGCITHHCTASIGVAMFINHEVTQDELLKWADMAMYQAKKAGRNRIWLHE